MLLEQRRTLDLPRDASAELPGPIAGLLVPIVHGGTLLGGLFLVSSGQGRPPEQAAFAEGVASQISLALVLARSFDDRAASERRSRESEALLRSIFDSIGDGVVAVDGEGRLTHCNSAAVAMFGAGPMDARASDWAERYGLYREDQVTRMPGRDLPLVRALRGESPDHVELYLRRPTVSEGVWLSVTARPLRLENGRIGGAVAAFRDITSEKATQGQLMVSDRMASVGMLAAGVAHEINNPLAAVLANLDCASATPPSWRPSWPPTRPLGDLPETLRDGRDAAERVRQIVRDLKIFSRAEEDTRGPVDIQAGARVDPAHGLERDPPPGPAGEELRPRPPGRRQRVPAGPGVPEPGGQRRPGHPRGPGRPQRDPGGDQHRRQRPGGGRDPRHRPGHAARDAAPAVHPVLHHQGAGRGHRAGPGHLPAHRHRDRRRDRGGVTGGRRHHLSRDPPARQRQRPGERGGTPGRRHHPARPGAADRRRPHDRHAPSAGSCGPSTTSPSSPARRRASRPSPGATASTSSSAT